jgi:hypothetical protein
MRVDFDITCIDHQSVVIRIDDQYFQQFFPRSFVPPATKPTVSVFPVALLRREIPLRRTCAKNPETRIDELSVIAGAPSPCVGATREAGFEQ